ncbi:MAG: arabinan endo,5-alpha-L-arabinosidase [Actinomycetota bacterium]|nr:arabinan endo,5-alpha-L-arabinosidase [Actinomycetota bacterium]
MTTYRALKKGLPVLVATIAIACVVPTSDAALRLPRSASEQYTNSVYPHNAGDPAVLRAADGTFYTYTTQTSADGTGPHLPVLRSSNLVDWTYVGDALPSLPGWALDGPNRDTWAPHVIARAGGYYLYYSARHAATGDMAIGVATASTPEGPFQPLGDPLVMGDSIDPFVMESGGNLYMYWMVPREPIRAQQLSDDGLELVGPRRTVLRPAPDRPYQKLIEGPWVVQHGGWYYLFYSGNHCCAPNPHYALMVARSRFPRRDFQRFDGNPIMSANSNFEAPGHNSVIRDAAGHFWTLYHAISADSNEVVRYLMLDRIRWRNGWPRINGGRGPSSTSKAAPQI